METSVDSLGGGGDGDGQSAIVFTSRQHSPSSRTRCHNLAAGESAPRSSFVTSAVLSAQDRAAPTYAATLSSISFVGSGTTPPTTVRAAAKRRVC